MTPALDHRSAARILDLADPADASSGPRKAQAMAATVLLFAISAIAAHATVAGGSPTAALGADSFSARVGRAHAAATQESSHMHRLMAVAASGAVAMGSSAFAQDAVQWRVEDGGNGHWYQALTTLTDWSVARDLAVSLGGHLATVHSDDENAFIRGLTTGEWQDYWLGAFRSGCTPSPSPFIWVTGEPWTYSNWLGGEPDCVGWNGPGTGTVLEMLGRPELGAAFGKWSDESGLLYYETKQIGAFAIIEWSADCNSDGLVDYGQIRAGELDDVNANNIPDCCEAGTACGCAADISGNGIVDAVDLAAVLSSWGNAPTGKTNADINRDGEVNAIDLAEVLSSWGTCP